MPAEVLDDPLGIVLRLQRRPPGRLTLGEVASAQLARDLLTGLAELVHPHGTVDAAGSVRHYVSALRVMDAALAEHGFTGGAADLRRGQVAEFWMGATGAEGGMHPADAPWPRRGRGHAGREGPGAGRGPRIQPAALPPTAAALPGGRVVPADRGLPVRGDEAYREHRDALAGAARGQRPRWRRTQPGRPAVAAGPQWPHVDARRRGARRAIGQRNPPGLAGRIRAVPAPGHHHRLRAAVQRLLRHRPRWRR